MIDWLRNLAGLMNAELGTATAIRAIVVALVISWCWTQATKGLRLWRPLTDAQHRWATRFGALLSGALPAFVLWPVHDASAVVMAIAVGMASPFLYALAVRLAVRKWPFLEQLVSARPELPDDMK